jgi:DNA end-binding protein Ku
MNFVTSRRTFEGINTQADPAAVGLAKELFEAESGRFEPEKMPDKYAETLRELLRAKVEQRAPQIEVATDGKAPKEVINIMAALKETMQDKGGPRCPLRRKGKGREPHDQGQARVGRRIEQGGGFRGRVCLRRAEAY